MGITVLTPRLRYVVDDFKEEDSTVKQISGKSDVDQTQKPVNLGFIMPRLTDRTPLRRGSVSPGRNSPMKNHPVLYLDLAKVALNQPSRSTVRDSDITVPNVQ